jgi:predicted transposase/invertase (TIGR01784 family)
MEDSDDSPERKELADAMKALETRRTRRDPQMLLNPRVDYVFKRIFGADDSESGSEALRSLLSSVMDIPSDRVEGLMIRNSEVSAVSEGGKCIRLDLLVLLADGTRINVEMQVEGLALENQMKRIMFYLCRLYSTGMQAGQDYNALCPTVSIVFTDRIYYADDAEAVHVHRLRRCGAEVQAPSGLASRSEDLTDALEVRIVEMKKARIDAGLSSDDSLARWLCFFEYGEKKEVAKMLAEKDTAVAQAVRRLEEMSILDDEWVVAFEREKAILWEAMNRHYMEHHTEEELAKAAAKAKKAIAEAGAEGKAEGRAEGKAEGKAEAIDEMVRRFIALGLDMAVVAEVTGSTMEEVEKIKAER